MVWSHSWCLAEAEQLWSETLCCQDDPLVERADFLRRFFFLFFFWSVPVGIFRSPASSTPSLEHTRQKGNPGIYHHVVPWVPSWSVCSSPTFRILCICFPPHVGNFPLQSVEERRKVCILCLSGSGSIMFFF